MDDGRFNKDFSLMIYDMFGLTAPTPTPTLPQTGKGENWVVNVSTLPPGIYLAIVREGTSIIASVKFVVSRR